MSQKVRLVSAARHIYAGRLVHIGESFEASAQDAEDLIALHFASPASSPPASIDDLDAALAQAVPIETSVEPNAQEFKKVPPRRRTYQRRDMKAED